MELSLYPTMPKLYTPRFTPEPGDFVIYVS
jgi:hypothetical protein